jgi:hypothetical protein
LVSSNRGRVAAPARERNRDVAGNATGTQRVERDKGEPRGSSPPTPSSIRVHTRRFDRVKRLTRPPIAGLWNPRVAADDSVPSQAVSWVSSRLSVMKASGRCRYWIIGRLSPMSCEAFWPPPSFGPAAARSRSCEPRPFLPFRASVPLERTDGFDLLCPLLTPAPRSENLTAPSVRPRRRSVRARAQAPRGKGPSENKVVKFSFGAA